MGEQGRNRRGNRGGTVNSTGNVCAELELGHRYMVEQRGEQGRTKVGTGKQNVSKLCVKN